MGNEWLRQTRSADPKNGMQAIEDQGDHAKISWNENTVTGEDSEATWVKQFRPKDENGELIKEKNIFVITDSELLDYVVEAAKGELVCENSPPFSLLNLPGDGMT